MKMDASYEKKAELLKVLAHPVRLCIVKGLMGQSCNVTNMQECLSLPQSTVSQHLGILRSRGVIKGTRNGVEITYSIASAEAEEVIRALFIADDDKNIETDVVLVEV